MTFVILTPALACPSLVKKNGHVEVLLLAREKSLTIRDELSNITYSAWKTKKEKSFDKKDIEVVPIVPSEYHISTHVVSAYEKEGFTDFMKVQIRCPLKKGLYQLNNPCAEDISTIINGWNPPSFSGEVSLHHPFFVGEKDYLTIAHVSDSHIASRMDMLEERWNTNFKNAWCQSSLSGEKPGEFSNFNTHFEHILHDINADNTIDMIIHTGDITDYNKGYYNLEGENDLSKDYYLDKNWSLFYELLYKTYKKPFFSVLGNHDYRVNPYPPNPVVISRTLLELFNMAPTVNLTRREMNTIHEDPHALNILKNHLVKTRYAVRWYNLVLNPLLDYQVFYGNMAFILLDWNLGEDHEEGNPWAEKVISRSQWTMLRNWHKKVMIRRKKKKKKFVAVVVMHSSVFNPFSEMGDKKLRTNPETNIFYKSLLVDTYKPDKDLVDGTFRLRRNEFIKLCLGNRQYAESLTVNPERCIDVILTGHAHRTGFFQVEGPHVYVRDPDNISEGPVFCNAISSGPIGIKNEEGGIERVQLAPPGYHVLQTDGRISIEVRSSDLVSIREDARRSFGEIAQGETFEVEDSYRNLPGLSPVYSFRITNAKEGSTITKVRVFTRLHTPVDVVRVPLGWKHTVEEIDGFTCITCEAHDRGQGIFHQDIGEIQIRAEEESVERLGALAVAWDMTDDLSLPVCVRVPSD